MMRRKDRQVEDVAGIIDILAQCRTCCVAMQDGDGAYAVPLSYGFALREGVLTLYFHSAHEGKKIDLLRSCGTAGFVIACEGAWRPDEIPCRSGYDYASVIGSGQVTFIDDPAEKCRALGCLFAHQSGKEVTFSEKEADTVCVFQITSRDFSGKRKRG